MSSAFGVSGLFLLCGCLCCGVFGGKSPRGRHTSRFWGTKLFRVDRMPYAKEEHERRGQYWDGIFKGDVDMPARSMTAQPWDTEQPQYNIASLTFDTLMGTRPASRQWAPVASR